MGKVKTAAETAAEFIQKSIADRRWNRGDPLPPLAALAKEAGVSMGSMWSAAALLKKESVLSGKKNGSIFVGERPLSDLSAAGATSASKLWQKKKILIEQDILNGRFQSGTLLSTGELMEMYGVCYATLKKILNVLVAEKLLVPYKKTYRIPVYDKKRYRQTILLITDTVTVERLDVFGLRTQKIIEELERMCLQSGNSLVMIKSIFVFDKDLPSKVRAALKKCGESLIGSVVHLWSYADPEVIHRISDVIDLLARTRKPAVIVDEENRFELSDHLAPFRNVRVFTIGERTAAQTLARMLLGNGHKRIAYFSLAHSYEWSKRRFDGLVDQYDKAGFRDAVVPFTFEVDVVFYGLLRRLPHRVMAKIMNVQFTRTFTERELSEMESILDRQFLQQSEAMGKIRTGLELIEPLLAETVEAKLREEVCDMILNSVGRMSSDLCMERLMKSAVADPRITAWVMMNDDTAITALRYLEKQKVQVPAELSVAGFDNLAPAASNKLTTIDFNHTALAHQAFMYLMHPSDLRYRNSPLRTEIEPLLYERATTGKAGQITQPH